MVQIDYHYITMQYEPLGVNRGLVTMANKVNMKLDLVPLFIIEFISKKFCVDFMEIVMKVSEKFPGSVWEEQVKRNP